MVMGRPRTALSAEIVMVWLAADCSITLDGRVAELDDWLHSVGLSVVAKSNGDDTIGQREQEVTVYVQ